jgi:hypothetical protein
MLATRQIRLMKFLLEAITRNGTKIFLTILLCLVVLYVFATISYMTFRNEYGFDGQHDCETLVNCFKLHVDYGIANTPTWEGVGAIVPKMTTSFFTGSEEVSEARHEVEAIA